MKEYKSARQRGYDELFDEVCMQLAGKHNPKNEEERLIHCELINDVIKITKELSRFEKSIFLIEKGWIDPMENHIADGYNPFSYVSTEKEAKEFCEPFGFWTHKDCWSIEYTQGGKMPKYRYKEIKYLSKP